MKFINEIKDGDMIVEHYLCKQKQILKTRSGKNYISLKLQDKTGIVDGKVWDINHDIQSFEENQFIKIDAHAIHFQNDIQLNIRRIRRSQEGEFSPENFIPATDKNIDDLYEQLIAIISTIETIEIKTLLENIFIHHPEISKKLRTHSAGKSLHHSYRGGLLEHTISVAEICDFLSQKYKFVHHDILMASALLHDIGKMEELSDFPENDYTDAGQLLGHIIIGLEFVQKEMDKIDQFSEINKNLIKHCLISHHGEYEYGSPKLPKTMEAYILHAADNADAKIKHIEESIAADTTKNNWLSYNKMLGRKIRKSPKDEK